MYRRPWERFSRELGQDLPQLSATDNRSMNVTLQREKGAQEGEQKQLEKHMSHSHRIQTSAIRQQSVKLKLSRGERENSASK